VHQRIREFLGITQPRIETVRGFEGRTLLAPAKAEWVSPQAQRGWLFVGRGFSRDIKEKGALAPEVPAKAF
jgi:hypothetical protein